MPRAAAVRRVLTRPLRDGERIRVTMIGLNSGEVREREFNIGDDYIAMDLPSGDNIEVYADHCESIEVLPPEEPGIGSVAFANGAAWQRVDVGWQSTTGSQVHWDSLIAHDDLMVLHSV